MSLAFHKKLFLKALIVLLALLCTGNISAQLLADFSATPVSGCAPLIVQFTDLSTGNPTSWKWDLGNGTITSSRTPSTIYFVSGKYKITLVVTNAGGSNTIIKDKYIDVLVSPAVNFSVTPSSGCLPLSVQFTDQTVAGSGSLNTWQWDFGDGSIGTSQNLQHTYTSPGTFDVTLQVKNNFGCGGAASKSKLINTGDKITAGFKYTLQSTCKPPVTLDFQNLSAGSSSIKYQWDFGDGTVSTQTNPSHVYTTAGNFTIQLTALTDTGGCSDKIQKTIDIGTVTPSFVSPVAVCAGVSFSLTNTSLPVPVNVSWDFGDGTTSGTLNPDKLYNVPGNYTIKMIADFGACLDSVSKPVTVLSKQKISFTADDSVACLTPFTVNFTSNVPGATSYSWDFGDGSTSVMANPAHTYSVAGNYDVTLIITNISGCQDTLQKMNYIKVNAPTIDFPYLPLKNCIPFAYPFTAVISSPDPVLKYNWDFGDGGTDTTATPTHTFTLTGSYTVSLTIATIGGCSAAASIVNGVIAGNKPVADFSASPLTACANIPINFTDLSTGNVNEWLWDFGDKRTSTTKNPSHVYADTGYFKVKLTVSSDGCSDSISFPAYVYIKPPISKFTSKSNCIQPLQKSFIDSSKGADSWEWNFGDGSIVSALRNPVHTFPDTGNYIVTLKVTNFSTGCDNTKAVNIQTIKEKAKFTAIDTNICRGTSAYFKSLNNASGISSFNWNFGDGSPPKIVRDSASHEYVTSGFFNARLIITDKFGCRDTLLKPAYINVQGPVATFSSTTISCANTSVIFIDGSANDGTHPIIQWVWDYGDNTTDILSAPPFTHRYINAGTYSIKLNITDTNGCTDSLERKNYLAISKPVAVFTSNDTITCPTAPVQFINTSQGTNVTYLWNFGDGTASSDANPVHQYMSTSVFTVSLTITDQYGCTDSIKKINYVVVALPIAGFTLSDSISACPPFLVTFTNTSVNYNSFLWDFGDGNSSSSSPSPVHIYYVPGTYIVKLRVTGPGGCVDEKLSTIIVNGPKGVLNYSNLTSCDSLKTDFKATAQNNLVFIWDFNDGTILRTTDSSISHTYTDTGFYLPKLILEDANGCQVPFSGIDTIRVFSIQANFNALSTVLCDAGNVSFNDAAVSNDIANTWLWDFGDRGTSAQQNPVHNYTSTGLYSVSQIVTTANGCKDTAVKNDYIKVVARPDIAIQSSTTGCESDTLTFKGIFLLPDTSIVTWQWDFKNGQTSALQDPQAQTFSPAGNYIIDAIAVNSSGCKDTATQSIIINPLPVTNAGNDMVLCLGSTAQLQASGAGTYQWVSPVNFLSCTNCFNPATNTPDDITYIVKGTNSFGCTTFDSVNITVKKPFTVTTIPSADSLCIGQGVQLNASGAENYLWSPASGLSAVGVSNPNASPAITTLYKVVGYDSANCFKDSAFVNISVFKYPFADAGPDKTISTGASVMLSPVYSNDITNWLWTPAAGLSCNNCPAPVAKPPLTTVYTIRVTNNGGCSTTDSITIFATCNSENIFIPNTFSPNGDGINDVFYPRGKGLNRIRGMKIFNRWGELVFENSNFYANDPVSGWDGLVSGKKVPSDVYIFVIDIICDNNDVINQRGNITLLR
ncbi:MAG: PKD domain-containing protein [Ginsengibacter sp.]